MVIKIEGVLREYKFFSGCWGDTAMYAVLKEAWREANK